MTDKEFDGYQWFEGTKTEGYDVYKLGEAKATRVYEAAYKGADEVVTTNAFTSEYEGMGVYKITVNNDGWVVDMDSVTVVTNNNTYDSYADENTCVDYGFVYKDPKVGSFQLADKNATDNSDIDRRYNVDDEKTVYINVLVHTKWIELETGSKDDVKAGSPVFVTYDQVYYDKTEIANAEVVYVIKDASDVETVKDYAVAVRKGSTDTINLTGESINVENYKITESVNGADATNYAYLKATAKAVIERMTYNDAKGTWEYTNYDTAEWTVTCPAKGDNMSALLGSGTVALEKGTYRVTVTVSNDDIGTLKVASQKIVLD